MSTKNSIQRELTIYIPAVHADPLTDRVRATWTAGDFGRIAKGYEIGAAELIARLHLQPRERVLDVACGTGNLALPAARAGARVTGIDIAPNLVEQARERAAAEGLAISIDVGNCEELPYPDRSFDTAVSMFGAMFAPRPTRVAAELARVVRAGGRIAMANWTATGFIGQMLKTTTAYVPPPADVPSVLLWGSEDTVRERLGGVTAELRLTRRMMTFEYPFSPAETVAYFRARYGPTLRAFAALDAERQEALRRDLEQLWTEHNRATDGTTRVESEYLEVIAVVA
jgi:2-polyprenyl-3-methyl-5-hydroxy-6-metoxy-1,4-benzoquinol methylase